MIDQTHDPRLTSWVAGAAGHPLYPIQNLPMCVFTPGGGAARGGVVIGDHVLDLACVAASGVVDHADNDVLAAAAAGTLNGFFALPQADRRRLRTLLSRLLSDAVPEDIVTRLSAALLPVASVEFRLPAAIGDYTDFFAGIHHARTAGKAFRPDNPLLPNYKHVPIAYNGRSSTIRVSGTPVRQPSGQRAARGASVPTVGPSQRLDYELELALWIGPGNPDGIPIAIGEAGSHIAGYGLLNDWSARDIQSWETQPLGPFLGKNFQTSVSPLVVTAEALEPFRVRQADRPEGDPSPQRYLLDEADQAGGAIDANLTVSLRTAAMRERGEDDVVISRSSALELYWTPAQMVAHHSSNGCVLRPGDLFGSGTVSSDRPDGYGSILELAGGGQRPVQLPGGESRIFLEIGDEVVMRARCGREGFASIGLGEVRGTVVAGRSLPV